MCANHIVASSAGENDVICGGSRMYHFCSGNKRFRKLIEQNLQAYVNAPKAGKSALINLIIETVRKSSTSGGFLQKDPLCNRFVPVSDQHAVCGYNKQV